MEKTNSVETSETPELCREIGTVNCRVPDWSELMEALRGTQDLMIFDGFRCRDLAGGAVISTGREAVPGDVEKSIMEAFGDPNIYTIGVCGLEGGAGTRRNPLPILLESIIRKVKRDNLFDLVVTESMRFVSDLTEVQKEIARQLGLNIPKEAKTYRRFYILSRINKKEVVAENARQLSERIQAQPRILFILRECYSILDLAKLGIPIGVDHKGCKLILTSPVEEILSTMNVQQLHRV